MFRHKALAWAVVELRARMRWGQEDLAHAINRFANGDARVRRPDHKDISRWENGEYAPASVHRRALGKIAEKYKYPDLAKIFRAAPVSWEVAALTNIALFTTDNDR
jgi:transcriptional regulator with XRE-family HTH domain